MIYPPNTGHPVLGDCHMRYSYAYKRMCVALYRQGKWPETPEETQKRDFHKIIRSWTRIEGVMCARSATAQNKMDASRKIPGSIHDEKLIIQFKGREII